MESPVVSERSLTGLKGGCRDTCLVVKNDEDGTRDIHHRSATAKAFVMVKVVRSSLNTQQAKKNAILTYHVSL